MCIRFALAATLLVAAVLKVHSAVDEGIWPTAPYQLAILIELTLGVLLLARTRWQRAAWIVAWGFSGAALASLAWMKFGPADSRCQCLGAIEYELGVALIIQGVVVVLATTLCRHSQSAERVRSAGPVPPRRGSGHV